jgi:hypothetical protein
LTLASVVIPLKDSSTFWPRFVLVLQSLLKSVGIPEKLIDRELSEYRQVQLTRKTNRHTLGSMNDFVYQVKARFEIDGKVSLESIALELSQIPCGPAPYIIPREAIREVLAAAASEQ